MAEATISKVLGRLADITLEKIGEEINLIKGVKEEIHYISSELTTIRNVLEDAEKRRYKEKSIQNWLNKLEDISCDVDDVLDEWNFAILKRQIEGSEDSVAPWPKVCSLITSCLLFFKEVAPRHDIAVKIKGLKERLDVIVEEKGRYGFTVGTVGQVADPRQSERDRSTSFVDPKEIQGREDDKEALISKLIRESAGQESGPEVVSIVGTGGIGKTTVAQLVCNDDRVNSYFDRPIWICVSDVFDEVRIAKEIVEIVEKSSPKVTGLEALLNRARNCISGKRFLLVLDDVWTEDRSKWEPIKNCLKCGGPGSKILVTTRSERVARMMGTIEIHRLGQLSDTYCWLLMQQIAFSGRREEERVGLQDSGKTIAKKCKGLPLAAKVLGSLLLFKNTVEEWENVLNSEIWELGKAEEDLFPHLLLSYNELSPAMKRCFSHCSIFPRDSDIDVKKLIRMWMASGYLGSGGSPGDLEVRGKEYFDTLRMRSFFQDFEEDNIGMSCKMHDIVHDFAQFLTKRRSHDSEDRDGRVEAREQGSCRASDPSLVSHIKVNRSLFCPRKLPSEDLLDSVTCVRMLSLCGCGLEEIPGYIANFIHLRFLDLSGNPLALKALQTICKLYNLQTLYLRWCELKEIPRELGNLIHLIYLDLSFNGDIKELPETICNLHDLETLNLESCQSLSRLPEEIHRLTNLRHLLNYLTPDLCQIPQGFEQLTALRTLPEFPARRGSSKLGYLKKLNQLSGDLELRIVLHGIEDAEEAQKAELRNKKHIKRLQISFFNETKGSDEEKALLKNKAMEALQPHPNLQHLRIEDFQGDEFPNWITSSLNHLKNLEIRECDCCPTLPPLGKLPCLESLIVWEMEGLEFLKREFLGISGNNGGSVPSSAVVIGFPKLRTLRFHCCKRWREWEDITAEEATDSALSIMPCLQKLEITGCGLTALPRQLLRKASALEDLSIVDSLRQS